MNTIDPAVRAAAADHTRALFAWAATACATPLPEVVRRRAATILADDIGAMVAGSREPEVARSRDGFRRNASNAAEATVFASGAPRLDRAGAACSNGMAIAWCELDEGFRNASCHAGAYTLPTLLAEAEARGLTVEQVVRAVAIAYEVTTRFALAYPFPGFYVHPHAAFATIGAAVAASLVRGHDAQRMQDTVTGAASMSFAGPFDTAVEGSLVRNGWTAAGAWVGMQAADWAEVGIAGGIHTPHDVFVRNFGTRAIPEALSRGLGAEWSVSFGYHKVFACCNYAHAAVEASLDLRSRLPEIVADDLAEIVVEAGGGGVALSAVEPETVLAAKFSMPHAVAAAATMGTGGASAFTHDTLRDATIAELRRRVTLVLHPEAGAPPHDRPGRVTWKLRDGRTLTSNVASPRGGADQPFDEPTLLSKLAENAGSLLPAAPAILATIIAGDAAARTRGWRETVAAMAAGAAPR